MAGVKLYNKTGDAKAVKIQEGIEKKFGFVPEVFQAMGRNGDFLDLAMRIAEAAGKGLDPKTKELIIIAVSAVNGCEYCLDAHRSAALAAGVTDEEISARRVDQSLQQLQQGHQPELRPEVEVSAGFENDASGRNSGCVFSFRFLRFRA